VFLYNKAHLRQNVAIPVPEATHLPKADGRFAGLVNIIVWVVRNHVHHLLGCYGCLAVVENTALVVYFSVNEVCCIASTSVAHASLDNCCKMAAVSCCDSWAAGIILGFSLN